MFGLLLGAAVGAAGYWAYQRWGSEAPAPEWETTNSPSTPGETRPSGIVIPTPSEVAGRPAEPIPS